MEKVHASKGNLFNIYNFMPEFSKCKIGTYMKYDTVKNEILFNKNKDGAFAKVIEKKQYYLGIKNIIRFPNDLWNIIFHCPIDYFQCVWMVEQI